MLMVIPPTAMLMFYSNLFLNFAIHWITGITEVFTVQAHHLWQCWTLPWKSSCSWFGVHGGGLRRSSLGSKQAFFCCLWELPGVAGCCHCWHWSLWTAIILLVGVSCAILIGSLGAAADLDLCSSSRRAVWHSKLLTNRSGTTQRTLGRGSLHAAVSSTLSVSNHNRIWLLINTGMIHSWQQHLNYLQHSNHKAFNFLSVDFIQFCVLWKSDSSLLLIFLLFSTFGIQNLFKFELNKWVAHSFHWQQRRPTKWYPNLINAQLLLAASKSPPFCKERALTAFQDWGFPNAIIN